MIPFQIPLITLLIGALGLTPSRKSNPEVLYWVAIDSANRLAFITCGGAAPKLVVFDLKAKVRMGCAIVHAVRQELMQMGPLPPHHHLENPVERRETDIARDLYSAPDGGLTVPEGDFELVQRKVRRLCCSWHGCFPVWSQ